MEIMITNRLRPRHRLFRWALPLMTCLLSGIVSIPATAGSFIDSLGSGFNAQYWELLETAPNLYELDDTEGGFVLAKTSTPNPGGLQRVAVALRLESLGGPVSGDFSTEVSFSEAVLPNTFGGRYNQIQFELYFENNSFFMLRRTTNPNKVDVYSSDSGYRGASSTAAVEGKFSVVRSGSTLSGYFDDTLLFSEQKSSPLTTLQFTLQNNNSNDNISVRYGQFSIISDSIPPILRDFSIQPSALLQAARFSGTVMQGTPGKAAILQSSFDLGISDPWIDLLTATFDSSGAASFLDVTDPRESAINAQEQFFRVLFPASGEP